jgi:hypothetical protein
MGKFSEYLGRVLDARDGVTVAPSSRNTVKLFL